MLGLQEARSAGSPKTYSCVACSAPFHSLASLLVHQASHASEASRQPESTLPTCASCGSLFASKELLEKHHCIMLPTPASPAQTFICDCGEEFSEFTALEGHKKQHGLENKGKSDLERTPIVPESKMPTCVSCGSVFESEDLLERHHCTTLPTRASPAHSYICDCGEEFSDFTAFEDHKKQHDLENKVTSNSERIPALPERTTDSSNAVSESKIDSSHPLSDHVYYSLSPFHSDEQPRAPSISNADINETESTANMDSSVLESHESHAVSEEQVQTLETDSDTLQSSNEENHTMHDNEKSPESCEQSNALNALEDSGERKKSILKMLASAYMRQPVQLKQRSLPPRKVSPRAPIHPPTMTMISKPLEKPLPKPLENQSKINKDIVGRVRPRKVFPKKRKIISVTQTLCPVVVLETRQKLFGRDKVEGRHQCRLCRRVFQDVDSLIMHHALHKKERVKFCLCCQQFVITVISVPENHVCFNTISRKHQNLMGNTTLKPVSPTVQQPEKLFYCSLCKRGYTHIRSLKKHNCPCKTPLKSSQAAGYKDDAKLQNLEVCNKVTQNSKTKQLSIQHIGVGTEPLKIEEQNTEFPIDKENQLKNHLNLTESHEPSLACSSSSKPTESTVNSVVPAKMTEMKMEDKDKLVEKQWTMPLDDAEIDVFVDAEPNDSSDDDCGEEDVVIVESSVDVNSELPSKGFEVYITSKGVKRFVCTECQRSYSRQFTLKEHLKVCDARKLKEQNLKPLHFEVEGTKNKSPNLPAPIKKFPCPQCGKFFSRKDNMNMHQKKCHTMKTDSVGSSRPVEAKTPSAQQNLFVLSPSKEKPAAQQESTQNTNSGRNWGIMSLPSVLPRRVTCECGSSFTCPRLLFEHLQQHAQESYICPHCGENLQSWMDFEAHQRLHKQLQTPTNEHRGSQVLPSNALTRPPQSFSKSQSPGLVSPQNSNHKPHTEPLTCQKCKKHFSLHSSLSRHMRLRCTGDASQRKHPCTRCGATFQNPLNLKVHVQSNTCKPAFKPIRCPVCVRWFSSLDGLKRHLVSHSRQTVSTCQICDQNFPTPQALDEHKRNVHGLNNKMRPAENPPKPLSKTSVPTTSPTPFQCHICLRYYPKLTSLKDHLRKVHRPKQPKHFQCQICDQMCPNIKSLKDHRRKVHNIMGAVFPPSKGTEQNTTSSQFQCHICARNYPDSKSLKNHRRRVHGIVGGLEVSKGIALHNLYKCLICNRSYPDEISLRNHRRRVHRILGPVPETSTSATGTNEPEDDLEEKPIPFL